MARDYRTLKLEILAETKQFVDDMKKSENQVEGFGEKMGKFGKVAAAAFAAAAAAAVAYAGKLAIDGVKAAIEDEAAQARLANALKNTTNATNEQIASVEKQIEKMSLAFGIADDELRPSFQRLATATGTLTKAQNTLQLALDISAATGKSVEAVSNALGKAYEGNTGALGRLGIGLSTAEIRSMGLEATMAQLAETFGGAATTQANTLEGQINRLKVGFDEAKESVGAALLPAVTAFINYITNRLIPMLIEAKDRALAPIKKAFEDNREAIEDLWKFTKDYLIPLFEFAFVQAIVGVGKTVGAIVNIIGTAIENIKSFVASAKAAINSLIELYNRIPVLPNIKKISDTSSGFATGPGFVNLVPQLPPGALTVSSPYSTPMSYADRQIYINVNSPSIIDETGFTRAVVDALNSVERRSAGGLSALTI